MAEPATTPETTDPSPLPPPISAHRLLGDGRSTALIRPDGEIDWWCAPELDSPPVCWSLLDPHGGAARWRDMRMSRTPGPPAGPTARTVLRHPSGRVECRDGLLRTRDGASSLVRLVRALDDDLDVEHELGLGGFDAPWAQWSDGSLLLATGTARLLGGHTVPSGDGRWLTTTVRARRGEWAGVLVSFGADLTFDADRLLTELSAAETAAEELVRRGRLPRHHPERAADALRVLAACTYAETGAVIASPTTSLPEAPGADRQFDYRYTWLRDASLAVSVAALLGQGDVADRYLRFVVGLGQQVVSRSPLTDVRGGPTPDEREVPGVAGWAGSRPIRVGNAAGEQVQYDALGLLVEAISVYLQTGGGLEDDTWDLVRSIADQVAEAADEPSNGIWEFREARPLVSADLGRWLALDRAIWIARGWRPRTRRRQWKRKRAEVRDRVLGALTETGRLPQSYDDDPPLADGSSLMVALFGMLRRDDPRAARLVHAVIDDLGAGAFVYRYEPGGDDGFAGREAAFLPVSWWAVAALAAVGEVDEARHRLDAMCAALPRLLAEEVDPETGAGVGNVPLVWSHMEAARTAYIVDAAALRDRYGPAGLAVWRAARYLSLRRASNR